MVADNASGQQHALPVFTGEPDTISYAEWKNRANLLTAVRKYEYPAVELALRLGSGPFNVVTQAVDDLKHPTALGQLFAALDRHHLGKNEDVRTMLDLLGATPRVGEDAATFAKRFDTPLTLAMKNDFEMNAKCQGALLLHCVAKGAVLGQHDIALVRAAASGSLEYEAVYRSIQNVFASVGPSNAQNLVAYRTADRNLRTPTGKGDAKLNPVGKNGKRLTCFICRSPNQLASRCTNAAKSADRCEKCTEPGHSTDRCPNSLAMVCWKEDTDEQEAKGVYAGVVEDSTIHAIFDTGCTVTCVGERTMTSLQKTHEGFVTNVHTLNNEDSVRIRFGAGDIVVAKEAAICNLNIPARRRGVDMPLRGVLKAYVVPDSDLPLLLSLESITGVFAGVRLEEGIAQWRQDADVEVQMKRGATRHWLIPLYGGNRAREEKQAL